MRRYRAALKATLPPPVHRRLVDAALAYDRTRAKVRKRSRKLRRNAWRRYYSTRYAMTYESTLANVRTRDQLPDLLNRRGLVGTGVEIGVQRGRNSEFLLTHWRGARLISVDPWSEAPAGDYVDRANVAQDVQDARYRETLDRLSRFGDRSEVWRTTSVEAAARVKPGTLDFVYIDARHDYASVLEDLEHWWPKMRAGGVIAGHDYVDGDLPNGVFEVKSAVDTFFAPLGLPVHSTKGRSSRVEMFPSWIVAVPE